MRGRCVVLVARVLLAVACTPLLSCFFDRSGIRASSSKDAGLSDVFGGEVTVTADGLPPDGSSHDQPAVEPQVLKLTFKNKSRKEALVGFVVLVTLTPSQFDYQVADPTGADLRFVDDDGKTALPHEIERWTPKGTSFVWVRVPKIDAGSDSDFITLRYGDPAVGKAQDPNAVWADHLAVYHLADDPGQAPPQIRDSSSSGFHGTAKGALSKSSRIDGRIGGALALNASQGDFIEIGDKEPLNVDVGEARTLQAWFRTATTSTKAYFLQNELDCRGWGLTIHDDGVVLGRLALGAGCPDYTSHHLGSWGTSFADTMWHHVAFVIDRSKGTASLFVDGQLVDSEAIDIALPGAGGVAKIGSNWNDSTTFDGAIDEVRISDGARSAEWIDAEHASMTDVLLDYPTR